MIGDFVSKLEYALYPQSSSTVDEFYLVSLTCPTKIALGIINGTENATKYESLANLISEFIETLRAFISCHSKNAKISSISIAKQLLNMLEEMKKKFKVKRWKFDWNDCIIIFVEFYSQFDFKIALIGSNFTKCIETTLHCIICHFNDVQLNVPHIEIRGDIESELRSYHNFNIHSLYPLLYFVHLYNKAHQILYQNLFFCCFIFLFKIVYL